MRSRNASKFQVQELSNFLVNQQNQLFDTGWHCVIYATQRIDALRGTNASYIYW